jgi:uncharacterized protein YjbJ (UPF0337 family)
MVDSLTADMRSILQVKPECHSIIFPWRVGRSPTFLRSQFMSINKDQVAGRAKEAAGKVQEVAGKTVGNTNQQVKGNINKNVGAAQAKYGDAKSHVKDSK